VIDSFETITLQGIRFAMEHRLSGETLRPDHFKQTVHEFAHQVVIRTNFIVFGQQGPDETIGFEIRYPADWWQHFRQRWCPRWIIRRWPLKFKVESQTVQLSKYVFYPKVVADGATYRVIAKPDARQVRWTRGE